MSRPVFLNIASPRSWAGRPFQWEDALRKVVVPHLGQERGDSVVERVRAKKSFAFFRVCKKENKISTVVVFTIKNVIYKGVPKARTVEVEEVLIDTKNSEAAGKELDSFLTQVAKMAGAAYMHTTPRTVNAACFYTRNLGFLRFKMAGGKDILIRKIPRSDAKQASSLAKRMRTISIKTGEMQG